MKKVWQCNMDDNAKIDVLIEELMKHALNGKSTEFQLIPSNDMYTATKLFANGVKKVIRMFRDLAKTSGLIYSDSILKEKTDLRLLLEHMQYKQCQKFYEEELKVAKSMLKEYRAYVFSGHVLKTILNMPRAEADMVDYRTLPWKLF